MKKEIIIICCIIVVIVITDLLLQNFTQDFFDEISNDLSFLENKMYDPNVNEKDLEEEMESIQNKWRGNYKKFAYFIEHEELEKVQTQLISIMANIKVEDYKKGVDETEKCKFVLKHITEKDSLKLVNIF